VTIDYVHDPLCPYAAITYRVLCRDCDRLRQARREAYREGRNAQAASAVLGYELYGLPRTNQHGRGENP